MLGKIQVQQIYYNSKIVGVKMRRKEIIKARKLLKSISVASLIIENLEGYYYYFNWQARQENKLHYCECGHCAFGSGKHENVQLGNNGVWIGPFQTRVIATQQLAEHFRINEVEDCEHCGNLKQKG